MKAIKRTIILCWIMLIVCCIIKLIGGNWFEIICDNEHFAYVCKYIDEHIILNCVIGLVLYVFVGYFIFVTMALLEKPTKRQRIFIIILLCIVWAFNFISDEIKFYIEIGVFIIFPPIINMLDKQNRKSLKYTWFMGIVGCILNIAFQMISLFIKNIGIKIIDDSFLITIIFSIDYYIMVILFYLYVKLKLKTNKQKKEIEQNG